MVPIGFASHPIVWEAPASLVRVGRGTFLTKGERVDTPCGTYFTQSLIYERQ
jgi:hypothetical protein